MYITLFTFPGIGFGIQFLSIPVAVQLNYKSNRNLVSGFVMSGCGIGVFAMSPVCLFFLTTYGWKGTYLLIGAINLHGLPLAMFIRTIQCEQVKGKTDDSEQSEDKVNHVQTSYNDEDQRSGLMWNGSLPTLIFKDNGHTEKLEIHTHTVLSDSNTDHHDDREQTYDEISCSSHTENTPNDIINKNMETTFHTSKDHDKNICNLCCLYMTKQKDNLFDCSILHKASFRWVLLANFCKCIVAIVPYIWLPTKALHAGHSPFKASLLVALAGVSDTIGRLVGGAIGMTKISNLLLLVLTWICSGLLSLLAGFISTYPFMVVYSLLYGFLFGKIFSFHWKYAELKALQYSCTLAPY